MYEDKTPEAIKAEILAAIRQSQASFIRRTR